MAFPSPDSTEVAIHEMIESCQRMITVDSQGIGAGEEGLRINPAMKRHFELEIQTLQSAPRDEEKLRELLKLKEIQRMNKK